MSYSKKPQSGIWIAPSTDDSGSDLTGIQSLDWEEHEQFFL